MSENLTLGTKNEKILQQFNATEFVDSLKIPKDKMVRAAEFAGFDMKDWATFIGLTHMAVAPESDSEWTPKHMKMADADGQNEKYLMHPGERQAYFAELTDKIRQLAEGLNQNNYDAYLERVSNAVALAIVEAHPYEDGNGRSARTIAGIVRGNMDDPDFDQDLEKLAENRSTENGMRMISFIKADSETTSSQIIDELIAADLPLEQRQEYKKRAQKLIWTPFL